MALTSYNFRKGVDVPQWEWMAQCPAGISGPGAGICSDGRYIYYDIQVGTTTAGSNSTTQLWRYDTYTNGWQILAGLTSGNQGIDIDYDPIRNVIWIITGNATTEWRYFNLNTISITLAGLTTAAFAISAAIGVALPAVPGPGSSFTFPDDVELPPTFDTGAAATGSTSTTLIDTVSDPSFHAMLVGCYVRYTSGTLLNQRRVINGVTSANTLTTNAFTGAPVAGDTYVVELPQETADSFSSTTIGKTTAAWAANLYSNHDVEITAGTGVGQRRRIASNTTTVLTLAAAVTGNPRTGPWGVTPDGTSVFVIKPSSDFVYYQPGSTSQTMYRCDIVATTLAWVTLAAPLATTASGAELKHPKGLTPFNLLLMRGNGTSTVYVYSIGLNTYTTLTTLWGSEVLTTGACSVGLFSSRLIMLFISASQRVLLYNVATQIATPAPQMPYASPGAVDGKRGIHMKTPDGVDWVYILRASGQEFFRIPLEWL